MIRWRASSDGAVRVLTGRAGGVSEGPWRGLNLAQHVGDDPGRVHENRDLLAAALGAGVRDVVYMDQVHGRDVRVVDGPVTAEPVTADALVTATPGLALAVMVADCVPVLLHAPVEGVVAAVHAGRRGMVDGVVPATVATMRELGGTTMTAVVGPSICPRCYEVPDALRDEVSAVSPVARSVTWRGTPSVDVAAGVLEQLTGLGVSARQLPGCTVEDDDLYSFRRDRRTGRFAGLTWLEGA